MKIIFTERTWCKGKQKKGTSQEQNDIGLVSIVELESLGKCSEI